LPGQMMWFGHDLQFSLDQFTAEGEATGTKTGPIKDPSPSFTHLSNICLLWLKPFPFCPGTHSFNHTLVVLTYENSKSEEVCPLV
uniref:Uncharacterized protein n=1 Tax=Takifugu rubripes TaxID=31033 RepID=A0A674P2I4_TAKRU